MAWLEAVASLAPVTILGALAQLGSSLLHVFLAWARLGHQLWRPPVWLWRLVLALSWELSEGCHPDCHGSPPGGLSMSFGILRAWWLGSK